MRDDPLAQFEDWWLEEERPDKMVVATATRDGRPSARYVLFKGFGETGFLFFSSYESRKGRELEANPYAALLFYWGGRQVRIEGRVERLDPEESDAYWASRPDGSKRSAAASHQSAPIGSREELEAAVAAQPEVPARPPHWGGYRVVPEVYEFWIHRDDRLHDRFRYLAVPRSAPGGSVEPTPRDGGWRIERLQP